MAATMASRRAVSAVSAEVSPDSAVVLSSEAVLSAASELEVAAEEEDGAEEEASPPQPASSAAHSERAQTVQISRFMVKSSGSLRLRLQISMGRPARPHSGILPAGAQDLRQPPPQCRAPARGPKGTRTGIAAEYL